MKTNSSKIRNLTQPEFNDGISHPNTFSLEEISYVRMATYQRIHLAYIVSERSRM